MIFGKWITKTGIIIKTDKNVDEYSTNEYDLGKKKIC